MAENSGHLSGVLPIVKIVRDGVSGSGKSLRAFADDRRIAYSTIRRYHDKKLRPLSQPPRKETLRELALALDLPLRDVEQAALESLSYRAAPEQMGPRATEPDETLDLAGLTRRERAALAVLVEAMKESADAATKNRAASAANDKPDHDEVQSSTDATLTALPSGRTGGVGMRPPTRQR